MSIILQAKPYRPAKTKKAKTIAKRASERKIIKPKVDATI